MSTQPEALRIADECEQSAEEWLQEVETRKQAAADLRRLHAEVVSAHTEIGNQARKVAELHAENEANERNLCQLTDELAKTVTLLRQALELLEDNREDVARVETTYMHKCYDPVLHAIKRHLENGS